MEQEREKFNKLNQPSNPNMPKDTVETLKQIQKQGLSISIVGTSSPSFPLPQQASIPKQNIQTSEKVTRIAPRPQSTPENKPQTLPQRLTSTPISTARLTPQNTPTTQGSRPVLSNSSSESKPHGSVNRTIQPVPANKISNVARVNQIASEAKSTPSRSTPVVLPENKNQGRTTPGQRTAQGQQLLTNKLQNSQDGSNMNPTSPPETKVFTRTAYVVTHDSKAGGQRVITHKLTETANQVTKKQTEFKTTPVSRVIPTIKAVPDTTPGKTRLVKIDKSNIGALIENKMANSPRIAVDNGTPRANQNKATPVRLHPNVSTSDVTTSVHAKLIQSISSQAENKMLLQGEISPDTSMGSTIPTPRNIGGKRVSSVSSPAKKKCIKRTPPSNNSSPEAENENGEQIFSTLKSRPPGLTITPIRPAGTVIATPTSNSSGIIRLSSGEIMDKETSRIQCPSCNSLTMNSKWCPVCKCDLSSLVQSSQQNTEISQKLIVTKNVTNVMVSKQIIIAPPDALGPGQSIQFGQTVHQQKKILIKTHPMVHSSPRGKGRARGRKRNVEPVCLTLSSDEEDEHMQGQFNPFAEEMSNQSQMFPQGSEGSKSDQEEENEDSDDNFPGVTDMHPQHPDDRNLYEDEEEDEEKEMDEMDMNEENLDEENEEIDESELDEEEEEVPPEDEEDEEDEEQVMNKGMPVETMTAVEEPLQCRSVRIGSLKVHPQTSMGYLEVFMSVEGIKFLVPFISDATKMIQIILKPCDIKKMYFHFGRCLPIMFVYTTVNYAELLRKALNMSCDSGYFDPTSNDEKQTKITFLIDAITEEQRRFLRHHFLPLEKVLELDQKSANEILVKSTPNNQGGMPIRADKAQLYQISNENVCVTTLQPAIPVKIHHPPQPVTKLFTYPPPPQTGGITVTSEDLACLNEGEFLNDAIIDFYLKYIYYEKLSEYHREKTHIFSSYFYPRLTHKPERTRPGEEGQKTVQARRHSQVKTWTRHVDIFSKDFIIIPVNQNVHWFLAIICYPGLVPDAPESPPKTENKNGKASDNVTSTDDQDEKVSKDPNSTAEGNENIDENSTASTNSMYDSFFEPEEADSEEPIPEAPDSSTHPDKNRRRKEAPCICIFDSLNGPNRWRIAAMLREYLEIEWKIRKGTRKVFDRNTMQGFIMQCPQQTNYSDCGIYVLQYVESFFESPIPYFDNPIPNLMNWFPKEKVAKKRQELKDLILNLQKKAQQQATFRKANASESVPSSPSKTLQTDNR